MITFSQLGKFGQLGNQMFQIAATIGIANKNRQSFCFPEWEYQQFYDGHLPRFEQRNYRIVAEPHFHYSDIQVSGDTDLHGYFQSKKYWAHCEQTIRELFTYRYKSPKEKRKRPIVSIHIRRGDYLWKPDYHPTLSWDYYLEAMDSFIGAEFWIFSDDPTYCRTRDWAKRKVHIVEGYIPMLDLHCMSRCDHHIIANSSFSWWGSFLNPNPDKIIIAPKKDKWFGPRGPKNVDDLYLPEWLLI